MLLNFVNLFPIYIYKFFFLLKLLHCLHQTQQENSVISRVLDCARSICIFHLGQCHMYSSTGNFYGGDDRNSLSSISLAVGWGKKRSSSACKVVCIENLYKHINPFILPNILAGFAQGKRYSPCAISLGRNSRTRKLGFTLNPGR